MHLKTILSVSLVLAALAGIVQPAAAQNTQWTNAVYQNAVWEARGCSNDARGEWFREAKFGAFIHFGLYSELGGYWHGQGPYTAEQVMGLGQRRAMIPWQQYKSEVGGAFNPTNFDAKRWVSLIKKAGQKYLIVTTKHHDGFAMFHTGTTSYNVADSTPFGRDVIKELAEECGRQGIVFCPYYSLGDWSAADVMDARFGGNYTNYMFAQLKELLSNYGPIKMLWFDNYWYVNNQWRNDLGHAKELYAYVHALSPDTLMNDRVGRGVSSTDGDYATPENQLRGSRQSRYFEVVMTDTADDNWGWKKGATNYRKPADLIRNLIDCTSKGGNFVLNVGPMGNGDFPPQHIALIEAIGKWTGTNGEAIYGTVPAPECKPGTSAGFRCYTTQKGSDIYLHIVGWPTDGSDGTVDIQRTDFVKAGLLDSSLGAIQYSSAVTNDITTVKIKKPELTDPYATVLRLTFKGDVTK